MGLNNDCLRGRSSLKEHSLGLSHEVRMARPERRKVEMEQVGMTCEHPCCQTRVACFAAPLWLTHLSDRLQRPQDRKNESVSPQM